MQIEQLKTKDLIPYARNAKLHSESQVSAIAGSIKEFGFCNPVLIDNDNGIIAGHGRVLAAQKLKMKDVPCIRLDHLDDNQRRAYILADNRLAEIGGGWDEEILNLEIESIDWDKINIDFESLDFENVGLQTDHDNTKTNDSEDNPYTSKIIAPIYTPKGDKPEINTLIDRSKTEQLKHEIDAAGLPEDIAQFLKDAAERHTVFHFGRIAEWYCHATPRVQDLMEKSGMVIIDFKKAIEYGFVHLTERLGKLADLEEGDGYDA